MRLPLVLCETQHLLVDAVRPEQASLDADAETEESPAFASYHFRHCFDQHFAALVRKHGVLELVLHLLVLCQKFLPYLYP